MPKVAIFFPSSLRDSLMHIFLEFTVEKKNEHNIYLHSHV